MLLLAAATLGGDTATVVVVPIEDVPSRIALVHTAPVAEVSALANFSIGNVLELSATKRIRETAIASMSKAATSKRLVFMTLKRKISGRERGGLPIRQRLCLAWWSSAGSSSPGSRGVLLRENYCARLNLSFKLPYE